MALPLAGGRPPANTGGTSAGGVSNALATGLVRVLVPVEPPELLLAGDAALMTQTDVPELRPLVAHRSCGYTLESEASPTMLQAAAPLNVLRFSIVAVERPPLCESASTLVNVLAEPKPIVRPVTVASQ